MMKKLLLMFSCVSAIFCGEQKRPQGWLETINYREKTMIETIETATLLNNDPQKGIQAQFDRFKNCNNLLLTLEENQKNREWVIENERDLNERLRTSFNQFLQEYVHETGDGTAPTEDDFALYKEYALTGWPIKVVCSIGASFLAIRNFAYESPKRIVENVIHNKVGQLAVRTAIAPIGFLQGLGADCYIKFLSSDDNHRMIAWSKVVAFTGDGF